MYSVEVKNNKEIYEFCMVNGITDINKFIQDCFKQGFDIKKYGLLGKTGGEEEKWVEKEVIVEKRVEIPVEIIKEVEKIVEVTKEVPVEKIIEKVVEVTKEVPVDRIVEKVVEVVKEVPVEKVVIKEVVKEVPVEKVVEKEVYITDDEQVKELGGKVDKLVEEKNELLLKIQQLEGEMSKSDLELDELRHSLDELLAKPPAEKIVEVVVEREITDNSSKSKLEALQNTLAKVRQETLDKDKKIKELEQTIQEIQKFQDNKQAVYLKGSNLDDKLYK
jgi:hypothetical protein